MCEYEDVAVLWSQAEHTDGEVTGKRPGVIIKNKKEITYIFFLRLGDRT